MVQAHRTSSNLLERHHSRACRVRAYVFVVVRLYRTSFSNYIFTGSVLSYEFRVVRRYGTVSNYSLHGVQGARALVRGASNLLEPSRTTRASKGVRGGSTVPNLLYLQLSRGNKCACTRLAWFKRSEPPRPFSNHIIAELARCRVLSQEVGVVRQYRPFSNYFFTGFAGCLCTRSGWFTYIEPPRTFSNHIIVAFVHKSSEWFA